MNDVVLAILLFVGIIPVMFFVADISERKNEIEAERQVVSRKWWKFCGSVLRAV
jgi:hypothetical protein